VTSEPFSPDPRQCSTIWSAQGFDADDADNQSCVGERKLQRGSSGEADSAQSQQCNGERLWRALQRLLRGVECAMVQALVPIGADEGGSSNRYTGKNPLSQCRIMSARPFNLSNGEGDHLFGTGKPCAANVQCLEGMAAKD
jgi:hypothetical protein